LEEQGEGSGAGQSSAAAPEATAVGPLPGDLSLAVLIPCHNEEAAIASVVGAFREALPEARIFVYDNGSSDGTAQRAAAAGARVRTEPWKGKGNVVRRMFADIDADVYLMVDGDGTYEPDAARHMVARLVEGHLDMVVGTRRNIFTKSGRTGHGFGNWLFNRLYSSLFGPLFTDVFSGYRVFSWRFVKSFPAGSSGFETETEMSVHASQLRLPVEEFETRYGTREPESQSKLRTFRDSIRILSTFVLLFKEIRPALFFGAIAMVLAATSLVLGYPLLETYIQTGLVPRLPTGVLASGIMLLGAISLVSGLILDSVARGRLEQKRLFYLGLPRLRKWRHD